MSVPTLTITDFLLARITEDEERARSASREVPQVRREAEVWGVWLGNKWYQSTAFAAHAAAYSPARVLAECEAKGRIIRDYLHEVRDYRAGYTNVQPSHKTVKHLTLPYADHPDYQSEWRP